MKKSRELLAILLLASATLACVAACGPSPTDSSSNSTNSNSTTAPPNADSSSNSTDGDSTLTPPSGEHVHSYTETVTAPTCTEGGFTTYTCECGDNYTDTPVQKLGHTESDWIVDKEATYENAGSKYKECTVCHEVLQTEEIPVLEKTASEGLEYTLSDDGIYYIVSGIGTCTDTALVIPSTYEGKPITSIGDDAFDACERLTSVVIPDSVTSIGCNAFEDCANLTSVMIGDGVTSIGNQAFRDCGNLTSITVHEGNANYQSIDGNLYTKNGKIFIQYAIGKTATEFTIPDSVTTIDEYAFRSCDSLTSITVHEGNANYQSIDGNLYTKDGETLIQYAIGKIATKFTIPDGVTSIGRGAFENCDNLTSIVIGNSVTSIGLSAFENCANLTSVVIGDSVTSIDDLAFDYCKSLTSVYYKGLEKDWKKISIGYFYNDNLINATRYYYSENQPTEEGNYWHYVNGRIAIWGDVLKASEGLKYTLSYDGTYYIVSGIGTCEDTDIVIANTYKGLPVKTIGEDAFSNCTSLTSVVIGDSVTLIDDSAFRNCDSLTSVMIGDSVTSIGSWAFAYCDSLTSMVIPDSVTSIGYHAFAYCNSLTSVEIPDSVTSIGYHAFAYCASLASIEIPDSVTSIGDYAFSSCDSLASIEIPDSVTSIGKASFGGCNLTNIIVNIGNINYKSIDGNLYTKDEKTLIQYASGKRTTKFTIPDSVTTIGDSAFSNCNSLTSVVIPDSVTSIGNSAFYNCTSLTSVEIPNSVTSIGDDTFYNCDGLTRIEIPDSVTSIGDDAFYGCNNLASVYITDIVAWCNISFYYYILSDHIYTSNPLRYANNLYLNNNLVTELIIPDSVTSIGEGTFYGCSGLKSVIIPDSVTSIGEGAFYDCTNLTSVVIGNSVTSIGYQAFAYCTSLTSLMIGDSVALIDNYAFYNCTNLTSVEIPDSVTSIGYHAFANCASLTSLVIGDSVASIGSYAFSNCNSLPSVVIPDNVTSISFSAFSNCDSLTSITVSAKNANYQSIDGNLYTKDGKTLIQYAIGKTATKFIIPDGVTSIGNQAFYYCISLTSVEIPDSVTSIGIYAFYNCESLTSVKITNSVTSIGSQAFAYCDSLTSLVIGDSVTSIGHHAFYNCFKLTSVYYKGIVEDWNKISIDYDNNNLTNATRYYYSETQPTKNGNYWHYDENGNVVVWR